MQAPQSPPVDVPPRPAGAGGCPPWGKALGIGCGCCGCLGLILALVFFLVASHPFKLSSFSPDRGGNTPGNLPGNNPGSGNTPGPGNFPGTGNLPGFGSFPRTGNFPGFGNLPGLGSQPGSDDTPGAGGLSAAELQGMVTRDLLSFNRAVQDRDFGPFYRTLSPVWQAQTTPEKLQGVFQQFIDKGIDIAPIEHVTPSLRPAPFIDSQSRLIVQGQYETSPSVVRFTLKYFKDTGSGEKWGLVGLDVDVGPPGSGVP